METGGGDVPLGGSDVDRLVHVDRAQYIDTEGAADQGRSDIWNRGGYVSNREEIWTREELDKPEYELPSVRCTSFPEGMLLPKQKNQYDIIMVTAKNIREKGSQLEILLKVKQADTNFQFDFLNSDSRLNPFYLYLKALPEREFWQLFLGRELSQQSSRSEALASLSMYSDDEDENAAVSDVEVTTMTSDKAFVVGDVKLASSVANEKCACEQVVHQEDANQSELQQTRLQRAKEFAAKLNAKREVMTANIFCENNEATVTVDVVPGPSVVDAGDACNNGHCVTGGINDLWMDELIAPDTPGTSDVASNSSFLERSSPTNGPQSAGVPASGTLDDSPLLGELRLRLSRGRYDTDSHSRHADDESGQEATADNLGSVYHDDGRSVRLRSRSRSRSRSPCSSRFVRRRHTVRTLIGICDGRDHSTHELGAEMNTTKKSIINEVVEGIRQTLTKSSEKSEGVMQYGSYF
jgi:hypothetical protein